MHMKLISEIPVEIDCLTVSSDQHRLKNVTKGGETLGGINEYR